MLTIFEIFKQEKYKNKKRVKIVIDNDTWGIDRWLQIEWMDDF